MGARWGDWLVVADQTHKIHLFEIRAKGSGVELHKAMLPVNQYATTSCSRCNSVAGRGAPNTKDAPAPSLHTMMLDIDRSDAWWERRNEIYLMMTKFSESAEIVKVFPKTFSKTDRQFVHEVAEELGLYHKTIGHGAKRQIEVGKDMSKGSESEQSTADCPANPNQYDTAIDALSFVRSGCSEESALIAIGAAGYAALLDSRDGSYRARIDVSEYDQLVWLNTKSTCTQPLGTQLMVGLNSSKLQLWEADTLVESASRPLPAETAAHAVVCDSKHLMLDYEQGRVHVLEAKKGVQDKEATVLMQSFQGVLLVSVATVPYCASEDCCCAVTEYCCCGGLRIGPWQVCRRGPRFVSALLGRTRPHAARHLRVLSFGWTRQSGHVRHERLPSS